MRVKVCGITRIEDAVVAADLGAYAVGFVFWPGSPRAIAPAKARAIGDALPGEVLKVGVFVDQPIDEVTATAVEAHLDLVQLHGTEPVEYARRLRWPTVKAVPVNEGFTPAVLDAVPEDVTVLLDAHDPIRRGGTGKTIDWTMAAAAAAQRPVILSGGLTPENVRIAIQAVRPYAIDLSSGVESAPGLKDHRRLAALFESIRDE